MKTFKEEFQTDREALKVELCTCQQMTAGEILTFQNTLKLVWQTANFAKSSVPFATQVDYVNIMSWY